MGNTYLYALDFDGVICDSAVETAITGWRAAAILWDDMPKTISQEKIQQFRLLRPIIETGYEAILAMRLLYLELPMSDIYRDYPQLTQNLLTEVKVTVDELKQLFGATRDNWIASDLSGWVSKNPLFDDIGEKLQALGQRCPWYVVTTKQERFVKQILQANAIELADECIFGLDRNLSKIEVLTGLLAEHPNETIHFVEDRLPTLLNVLKQTHLSSVELVFALWGYNTAEDKHLAAQQRFTLQHLDGFLEPCNAADSLAC